jgi:hypothetical protein
MCPCETGALGRSIAQPIRKLSKFRLIREYASQAAGRNVPYAIIIPMGMRTGLIIFILLGLLGAFFSFRAGIHSLQLSRSQASWPERGRQRAAGWRYFGLSIILVLLAIACISFMITGAVANPLAAASPTPSPTWTGTQAPPEPPTDTSIWTSAPTLTDTPAPTTATPVQTSTKPLPLSRTPSPSDTHWPTWTPSRTPTPTSTRTPTPIPSASSTRFPTLAPSPSDTHWPVPTLTSTK